MNSGSPVRSSTIWRGVPTANQNASTTFSDSSRVALMESVPDDDGWTWGDACVAGCRISGLLAGPDHGVHRGGRQGIVAAVRQLVAGAWAAGSAEPRAVSGGRHPCLAGWAVNAVAPEAAGAGTPAARGRMRRQPERRPASSGMPFTAGAALPEASAGLAAKQTGRCQLAHCGKPRSGGPGCGARRDRAWSSRVPEAAGAAGRGAAAGRRRSRTASRAMTCAGTSARSANSA